MVCRRRLTWRLTTWLQRSGQQTAIDNLLLVRRTLFSKNGSGQERCFLVQTKTWNMVVSGCLSSRHSNLPIRLHFTDPFRTSWPSYHLIFLPSLLSEAVQAAVDAASHNMHVTSSLADVGRYFFNYYWCTSSTLQRVLYIGSVTNNIIIKFHADPCYFYILRT